MHATLFAVLVAASAPPPHVPAPGYFCTVGKPFDSDVWINRTLDAEGRQAAASMQWRGGRTSPRDWHRPQFVGMWNVTGAGPLAIDDGTVAVEWQHHRGVTRKRVKHRLELTTKARAHFWPPSAVRSELMEQPHIFVAWNDIAAFAGGAERLFLVVRDERQTIVDQYPLDPAIVADGKRKIETAMGEMERISADFRTKCDAGDIEPGDIVVTETRL
ncbi:MAG: hypothetical protein EOP63_20195 [Sphingomonadales bacterium]|nr:MAG: hypothetical protein EOP63_20195 [Sphingomonadales bacterium]